MILLVPPSSNPPQNAKFLVAIPFSRRYREPRRRRCQVLASCTAHHSPEITSRDGRRPIRCRYVYVVVRSGRTPFSAPSPDPAYPNVRPAPRHRRRRWLGRAQPSRSILLIFHPVVFAARRQSGMCAPAIRAVEPRSIYNLAVPMSQTRKGAAIEFRIPRSKGRQAA